MFHQITFDTDQSKTLPNLDAEGRPIFDAAAYVAAVRAAGAELLPIRGKPGSDDLDGSFTISAARDAAALAAVQTAFSAPRATDPVADSRVAKFLLCEAATGRFAAVAQRGLPAGLDELARLKTETVAAAQREEECRLACDEDQSDPTYRCATLAADLADEAYYAAFKCVLAMPITTSEEAGLKAQFALRYCNVDKERREVLADIAVFFAPEVAGTLPDIPALAA